MLSKMKIIGRINCAGIYGMRQKDSQTYDYIGSSLEVNDARSRHEDFLKKGKYANTNKAILQEYYDRGQNELVFEVIKESCHNVSELSKEEKDSLNTALAALEEFYITLNEGCCNTVKKITRTSSNKNKFSTFKRRKSNLGENNPNNRYDEELIANILWLKINGFKPKEISKLVEDNYNINIKNTYISKIGVEKWILLEPQKPDFVA